MQPRNTVRAKFQCTTNEDGKIVLEARYDDKIPEDQRFAKATPSGRLEMRVDNPDAVARLTPGKSYYLDLIECEPVTEAQTVAGDEVGNVADVLTGEE